MILSALKVRHQRDGAVVTTFSLYRDARVAVLPVVLHGRPIPNLKEPRRGRSGSPGESIGGWACDEEHLVEDGARSLGMR